MAIFAIGDLHLPGRDQKPMDVFGQQWEGHFETICTHWKSRIGQEDVVLIPGDISWAMQLPQAVDDLAAIAALPGHKVLLRGNHDYWWNSITKVRSALGEKMYAIQNDAIALKEYVVCGTRGWTFPTQQQPLSPQDEKIYQRELMRLQMSLEQAMKRLEGRKLVVMMHYPPLFSDGISTAFTEILERYPVYRMVYGHLHGAGIRIGYDGCRNGICYRLVSCDALGFAPLCLEQQGLPEEN